MSRSRSGSSLLRDWLPPSQMSGSRNQPAATEDITDVMSGLEQVDLALF